MTTGGKRLRRGLRVYAVVGGIAKLELFNHLRATVEVTEDGEIVFPKGYVHLPQVDAEYVQQLCSEQLITRRDRNGFPFREWQKIRERNEALDCYVYARAAASLAGLDRFEERHWIELERQLGIPVCAEPPELRMDGLFPVQPGFETPEFLMAQQSSQALGTEGPAQLDASREALEDSEIEAAEAGPPAKATPEVRPDVSLDVPADLPSHQPLFEQSEQPFMVPRKAPPVQGAMAFPPTSGALAPARRVIRSNWMK